MGGGFGKIPVEMYSMDISMTAKVLYSYICNGAGLGQDEAGENTVSVSDLSSGINASHGATCNAIKELYEHGLIDIKKGRPCTYVVLDIFGCQWSNSDRQRSYNDRQKSNNDHQRSYNDRPYTLYKKNIKRDIKRDGDNTFSPPSPSYDERIFREKVAGEIKYIPRKED